MSEDNHDAASLVNEIAWLSCLSDLVHSDDFEDRTYLTCLRLLTSFCLSVVFFALPLVGSLAVITLRLGYRACVEFLAANEPITIGEDKDADQVHA